MAGGVSVMDAEPKAAITIDPSNRSLAHFLKEAEAQYLACVMTSTGGNKSRASKLAGIARDTFQKKPQRYTVRAFYRLE